MVKKGLQWTPKQIEIFNALQSGLTVKEISANLHVSYSTITDVKNAIAKEEFPPTEEEIKAAKAEESTKQDSNDTSSDENKGNDNTKNSEPEDKKKQPAQGHNANFVSEETQAKLVSVPVIIPITAVMQNWKAYLIQAKHWPADSKWQDIIDTTIYRYAMSLDPPVVLQGWYVGETKRDSPKPAPEEVKSKEKGNGHNLVDITSVEFKKLMAGVIVETISALQNGQMEVG